MPTAETVIDLRYPTSWFAPPNPHAPAVRGRLHAWLRRIGVVADAAAAAKLDAIDPAGYGGLPFPRAGRDVLETVTALLTLWIFHDDAIEGDGDDDGHLLLHALSGAPDLRRRDTPVVRGYRELGARLLGMSAAWRQRHVADFGGWLLSVDDEAALARRFRAGARIGVAEHLAVREINVGLIPVLDWIEHDLGRELPCDVFDDPAHDAVVRGACHAVAFANELYGYTKDRDAGWINAVACAEREDGAGPAAAFARVAALHDAAVAEVVAGGAALVARADDRALVADWLGRVHHVVAGFARWHAQAPRYRAVHATADGPIRLRLGEPPAAQPCVPRKSGDHRAWISSIG